MTDAATPYGMPRPGPGRHRPHRPVAMASLPAALLHAGPDPASDHESALAVAETTADALVQAARAGEVDLEELLALPERVGLDELTELWCVGGPGSVPWGLYVLYLLRAWSQGRPEDLARLAAGGWHHAEPAAFMAGLPEQPDSLDVGALVDDLLREALCRDLPDAFQRAASFCRVLAAGRGTSSPPIGVDGWPEAVLGSRLLTTAEGLDAAAARARS